MAVNCLGITIIVALIVAALAGLVFKLTRQPTTKAIYAQDDDNTSPLNPIQPPVFPVDPNQPREPTHLHKKPLPNVYDPDPGVGQGMNVYNTTVLCGDSDYTGAQIPQWCEFWPRDRSFKGVPASCKSDSGCPQQMQCVNGKCVSMECHSGNRCCGKPNCSAGLQESLGGPDCYLGQYQIPACMDRLEQKGPPGYGKCSN